MSAAAPKNYRKLFWREAFQMATNLDGLVSVEVQGIFKPQAEHWEGKLPLFCQHLRKWGEVGVVKLRTATTPKIMIMERYVCLWAIVLSIMATLDVCGTPKRVHLSRDIVWLN
jgi:hypothetical protein